MYLFKKELKEGITKKIKISYLADNTGVSRVYLSNIINSKVAVKKAIAYCITKLIDKDAEIEDYFTRKEK